MALLGIAMGSAALTLGRAQGVAWVGKGLDVQIQVQPDSMDELQPDCLAADVSYGETQLDPARVTVSATANAGTLQSVRIVSKVLVDEPFVTIQLRLGCQQKLSKRYTLFAELPIHVVEPLAPIDLPVKPQQRVSARPPTSEVTDSSVARVKTPKVAKAVVEPAPVPPVAAAPRTVRPAVKVPGKSRLKLDSLDISDVRDPILRASNELLSLPQEEGTKRAEAASLWRTLNLSPQQILQEDARARALEKDIKSLSAVNAQNQKGLIDLAAKVQQTESERYANWLVYTLMALCGASLGTLLWFWRRSRQDGASDWLHGHDAQDSMLAPAADPVARARPAPPNSAPVVPVEGGTSRVATAPPVVSAPQTEVDLDLDIDLDFGLDPKPPAVSVPVRPAKASRKGVDARAEGHRDFSLSLPSVMRSFDSEELVDAREQAEFFVSLGQYDRAIDILTTRVAQFGESSPLVYLDLLKIYHLMGRETEFEFMRTEFNHWFAGHIPEFAAFGDAGRTLEQYPAILHQISALWPQPPVLEYIEGCLYHHAKDTESVIFDLAAYLDLLFLHDVAKQIVRQSESSDDGFVSEALRRPASANAILSGPADPATADPGGAHRAGAQYRGTHFGAIKHPPTSPPPPPIPAEGAQGIEPDSVRSVTDFNFLGLR